METGAELPPVEACGALLEHFIEASDGLLLARSLQQRVDRKYVLSSARLEPLLAGFSTGFRIVRPGGRAAARYETQYFDTSERQMYHDHRRGRRPRFKVRIRDHHDRCRSFLEVKCKTQSDRTTKVRIELPFGTRDLDAAARRFIDEHCPIGAARLLPRVSIAFLRVTLVGMTVEERVTLDWSFECVDEGGRERMPAFVVAEVKQPRYSNANGGVGVLRSLGVREQAISKYCLATARLAPVRANAFKLAFRDLERLA